MNHPVLTSLHFNENLPYLLTGYNNGKINLYESDKLILVSELIGHTASVIALSFSSNLI
jgi:hypothetical protein